MPEDRDVIRSGDVEALVRRAKMEGKPLQSNMVLDKKKRRIVYSADEKDNVEIKGYDDKSPFKG